MPMAPAFLPYQFANPGLPCRKTTKTNIVAFELRLSYYAHMKNATGLSIITAAELLAADLPPRADVLAPLLASDTAALVYGPSGIGKSFFALSVAWAVASGGSFLGWQSPRPHRGFYLHGEMGAARLRPRLALFRPPPPALRVLPLDLTPRPLLHPSED